MPIIEADALSFRYGSDSRGLPPLSFEIQRGERVAIAGASRSGKSTLTRCLCGLAPHLYRGKFGGDLTVDGMNTKVAGPTELIRSVGILFQNPFSQILTSAVEDEVAFPLESMGMPPEDIASRLTHTLALLGLSDLRHRNPTTLSAGQQQKVALASLLARDPRILVLDEPLSMLDPESAEALRMTLEGLAGNGTTVIAADHREVFSKDRKSVQQIVIPIPDRAPIGLPPAAPSHGLSVSPLKITDLNVDIDGQPILRDINITVEPGQAVALVGRNGVGKTTLLRCIAGVQKHNGSISASDGTPDIRMTPQDPNALLFNATVNDEIIYGSRGHDPDFHEWLIHALRLEDCLDTQPLLLSEGQKKRVALAAALTPPPAHMILLDEPSIGQDDEQQKLLGRIIKCLCAAGHRFLIATHDLNFLSSHVSHTVVLEAGRVVSRGPTSEVLADSTWCAEHGIPLPSYISHDIESKRRPLA
jgi:energy-coupling factor transporter ATP-binding protein EcfA2